MRKTTFSTDEYYHIYNRGTDKRDIFCDKEDLSRFLQYLKELNDIEIIGSLRDHVLSKTSPRSSTPGSNRLVNIVAYCLNQNHFHFILEPVVDDGIQKFMHRLSTGYTNYFNKKNNRTGSLFQGRYKAKHISSNEYLLYLAAYVNLNDQVHKSMNKEWIKELPFSSMAEYSGTAKYIFCEKGIILDQFKNNESFVNHCKELLPIIQQRKEDEKEFSEVCLD